MPTQRFNTSRRQILRSYTEQTFYPTMFAKNVPYGARDRAYGATKKLSVAEQIGQAVGEIGTAAASEAVRLEELRLEMEAEAAREREETERAKVRACSISMPRAS